MCHRCCFPPTQQRMKKNHISLPKQVPDNLCWLDFLISSYLFLLVPRLNGHRNKLLDIYKSLYGSHVSIVHFLLQPMKLRFLPCYILFLFPFCRLPVPSLTFLFYRVFKKLVMHFDGELWILPCMFMLLLYISLLQHR